MSWSMACRGLDCVWLARRGMEVAWAWRILIGVVYDVNKICNFKKVMSTKKMVVLNKPYRLNTVVVQWVNAFASCAIEGNQLSIEMLELWNNNKEDEFVRRLEREWQPELRETYKEKNAQP